MQPYTSHYAKANGINIHYWRSGRGAPLVLLHGWPEFNRTWRRVLPLLAQHFDVIAPDLRGFGDSDKPYPGPSDAMTADVLADDLAGLLDALGINGRAGIVAHDVGAYAAQVFARHWPQRAAGLFFFNCPYAGIGKRWGEPAHLKEIWYQSFHQQPWAAALVGSSREACALYFRHFLTHWSGVKTAFDEDFEVWIDNFMKPGNLQGGFNWYISANRARLAVMAGETPHRAPIATPARVLWGERDPVLKVEWMDRLPEFFTDLEASAAPDAGHFVHMEQPALAAQAILDFFARIGHAVSG